jgi:subtilisin family serine protease
MHKFLLVGLACVVAGCETLPPAGVKADPVLSFAAGMTAEERTNSSRQLVVTFRDERAVLDFGAGATPSLLAGRHGYRSSGYARRVVAGLARDYDLARVTDWYIESLGVHCVVYRAADQAARDALLDRLRADRRVQDAQPMQVFRTMATVADSSLSYDAQADPYAGLQRAAARIGVPVAQQLALGRGVRIAIIDTGLDNRHADLAGRVESTLNLVDGDAAQFHRDRHGTAVAGVIVANADNGTGIRGVAPLARLIALKACWEIDTAGAAACNSLTLAAAIEAAIRQRVHLINLSVTGPADRLLTNLLEQAMARGIAVVGAAPTDNSPTAGFPAGVRGVIQVVDADAPAAALPVAGKPLRLSAPGQEVLTLAPGGGYNFASGVSVATALVSGVAALLLEDAPGAAQRIAFVARLPHLLRQTGDMHGRVEPQVNAARAVRAARGLDSAQK